MCGVASALAHMHASNVVHLDVKPENVLVDYRDDGSFVVKLIEFRAGELSFSTLPPGHTRT